MKKLLLKITCIFLLILFIHNIEAQVKIGRNPNVSISNGVLLELEDPTKALLLTRVFDPQVAIGLANSYRGMLVFDSSINKLSYYDGTNWVYLTTNITTDTSIYNYDGTLKGNRTVTMGNNNLLFNSENGNFIYNPTGTGKVGIGTTTPASTLDIAGTVQVYPNGGLVTGNTDPVLRFLNTGTATVWSRIIGQRSLAFYTNDNGTTTATNNNVSMFIHTSGNVGIGTNNPISKLQVVGAVRADSLVLNSLTAGSAINDSILTINTATGVVRRVAPTTIKPSVDTSIYTYDGTLKSNRTVTMGNNNLLFNSENGNFIYNPTGTGKVGIATTTPASTLDIAGKVQVYPNGGLTGNTGNTDPVLRFINTGWNRIIGQGSLAFFTNDNGITTATNTNVSMLITTSGNVGIGTAAPISKLQVVGAVRADSLVLNSLTAGSAITDSILTINTATGVVRRVAPTTIKPSVDTSIYTYDGTLKGNRTVTMGNNNLLFNSVNGNFIYNPTGTGKVGIGTAAPISKLQVVGAVRADSLVLNSLTAGSVINDSILTINTATGVVRRVAPTTIKPSVDTSIYTYDGTLKGNRTVTMGANNLLFNSVNGNFIYNPTGTGKVGIGTAAPISKLQVVGAVRADSLVLNSLTAGSAITDSILTINTATGVVRRVAPTTIKPSVDTSIYTYDGTLKGNRTVTMGANNLLFNSVNGNFIYNPTGTGKVGIGTAAPISKLQVVGAVRADSLVLSNLQLDNTGSNPGITIDGNGVLRINNVVSINKNIYQGSIASGGNGFGDTVRIGSYDGYPVRLYAGNKSGMTIKPTGSINYVPLDSTSTYLRGIAYSASSLVDADILGVKSYKLTVGTFSSVVDGDKNTGMNITSNDWVISGPQVLGFKVQLNGYYYIDSVVVGLRSGLKASLAGRFVRVLKDNVSQGNKFIPANAVVVNNGIMVKTDGRLGNAVGVVYIPTEYNDGNDNLSCSEIYIYGRRAKAIPTGLSEVRINGTLAIDDMETGTSTDSILTINTAGNIRRIAPSSVNASVDTSIYTYDGTLKGNRTVTMGANNLLFNSVNGNFIYNPTGTGKVGIGTSSPASTLDIASKVQVYPNGGLSGNTGNTDPVLRFINTGWNRIIGQGSLAFFTNDNGTATATSSNASMLITTSGDVGIGTTVPYTTLDVLGNIYLTNHGNTALHHATERGTRRVGQKAGNDPNDGFNGLEFSVDSLSPTLNQGSIKFMTWLGGVSVTREVARVGGNGNFGIGTSSPMSKLQVAGAVRADSLVLNNLTTGSAITDSILTINTATGVVRRVAPTTIKPSVDTNIYTYDGTLKSNRTVTMGTNNLTFTGSANASMNITNTTPTGSKPLIVQHTQNGALGYSYGLVSNMNTGQADSRNAILFYNDNTSKPMGAIWSTTGGAYVAPSIGFSLNNNLANDLNTDVMVLQSNGRVGIATKTPASTLDIAGKVQVYPNGGLAGNTGNTDPALRFANTGWNRIIGQGNLAFFVNDKGTTTATNTDASMFIDTSGKVGIGTTTPANALHVVGTVQTQNLVLTNLPTGANTDNLLIIDPSNNVKKLNHKNIAWSLTGNTGTDPATNFIGTTDVDLVFKAKNQRAGYLGENSTSFGYMATAVNYLAPNNTAIGSHALENNKLGSNNVAVGANALKSLAAPGDASSNVAVGYNAASALVSGSGNIAIGNGTAFTSTTASNQLNIGNAILGQDIGTNQAKICINGTFTYKAFAVYYNGGGGASCDGNTWTNTSDRRLKKDIVPSNYGLKEVMQLKPQFYIYKSDVAQKREIGLIAQEVQKIIPEIVSGKEGDLSKGEILGLSYGNLTAVLVSAMQQQQQQIEETKKQIIEQQNQIDELKQLVQQLLKK